MEGYQQVPRRVATGYFGLIFFIILSVVLVAGYVPVILALQRKSQDLEIMNQKIATHIEQEMRQAGHPLPVQPPMDGQTLRYGDEFFTQLKEFALFGVQYTTLLNRVGWARPSTVLDDIEARLASISPRHPNLRELIDYLESELQNTRARLDQTERSFKQADADRNLRLRELEAARNEFNASVAQLNARLQEQERKAQETISEFHGKWQESSTERQSLWEQYVQMEAKYREEIQRKEQVIDDQSSEIGMLREELRREVVVIPTEAIGGVLHSDLMHRFTIINRGKADNIEEGMELLVYRDAPGGRKIRIGKVIVTRTQERTSRADILEQIDTNPIMPNDYLYMRSPNGAR